MTGRRVGWLGGSFDPVHVGHVAAARAVADALSLDEVLLIPAAQPPHKPDRLLAPGDARMALLSIACATDPRLRPCDLELRRSGPSYSVDTAEALVAQLPPGARLYLIVGADMLADLPHWHRAADLLRLVTVCPVARERTALDALPLAGLLGDEAARAIAARAVSTPVHPASSTALRAALRRGEATEWLPAGVAAEIRRRGLYGAGGASLSDNSGSERSIP